MTKNLRKYLVTGVLVVLPLYFSVYILLLCFQFIDNILGNFINLYVQELLGFSVPGLGVILFFLLILLSGIGSVHLFGKRLHQLIDRIGNRFPVLNYIYPAVKQAFEFLFSESQKSFKKAVLVEYPCKGSWSVGFITNESFKEAKEKTKRDLANVFIPLAPNPVTGFIALIPHDEIILLDISVKEAMKLVISGGLLNPGDLPLEQKDQQA